jgi:predicted Zn finger-like uncharacterized protein
MTAERFTRCPHCATVFRVEPVQLKQAQAWLRCGQCQQPFDAAGRVVLVSIDGATDDAQRLDLETLLHTEDKGSMSGLADAGSHAAVRGTDTAQDELLAFEQALASFPVPPLGSMPPATTAGIDEDRPATETPLRRQGRWAGVWLLATLLVVQGLWATRAQWSVRWPWWGQAAQALCARWGCSLPSWRELQVLTLAHARLQQNEAGQSLLQWTLHNQASWPVQTPSLELTLLDAHDQVVVRRVFSAQDWRGPEVLSGGAQSQGELAWPALAEGAVTAYRLLAFYP